ncbi:MAG: HIT family protein [bacterium]|nr:HIT family protein [bacterium]MCP5044779.1 HIT family protein [bacterium]
MNVTAEKFGYPDSCVKSFEHWHVLVRPAQPTLGSLVLVCSDATDHFGGISPEASSELQQAVCELERVLGECFRYDKINYLMLMMVDPDVHFHVLPRYESDREYGGATFSDGSWPGPPDITAANDFPEQAKRALIADLRARFA